MMDFDAFADMVEELAHEIPEKYFVDLNGGIIIQPGEKLHPRNINHDLWIMGEYQRGGYMGRLVNIYYGSFMNVYGNVDYETLKIRVRNTLRHELTHHLESLAGEKDLEYEDAYYMAAYLQKHADKSSHDDKPSHDEDPKIE